MGFQDEMKQMFLRVAAGEIEPVEWEKWWNSNRVKLEETLNRGDRGRIMPALWSANYYWMTKTQGGVAYYFHAQGRPVKTSGYYEEKAREEEIRERQRAMAVMYRNAQLFLETKEIPDAQKRQNAIRETYEEVCRFMRYYHGLAKKTERS